MILFLRLVGSLKFIWGYFFEWVWGGGSGFILGFRVGYGIFYVWYVYQCVFVFRFRFLIFFEWLVFLCRLGCFCFFVCFVQVFLEFKYILYRVQFGKWSFGFVVFLVLGRVRGGGREGFSGFRVVRFGNYGQYVGVIKVGVGVRGLFLEVCGQGYFQVCVRVEFVEVFIFSGVSVVQFYY